MNWEREKHNWPHMEASAFLDVDGCQFHIQDIGHGPDVLLLHGSGATTHSWAGLIAELSQDFRLIVPDLPGHGFTQNLPNTRATLDNVSHALAELIRTIDASPRLIVGHSAGAAIGTHIIAAKLLSPDALVSINGAFYPFPGFARELFPAIARALFLNPLVPKFFAMTANMGSSVERLIDSTGSKLDKPQVELYRRAFRSSHHVEGTLAMMANWDLTDMAQKLCALDIPVLQMIGDRDGTVDPSAANRTAKYLRRGRMIHYPKGHLVHEEIPNAVATDILAFALSSGILPQTVAARRGVSAL